MERSESHRCVFQIVVRREADSAESSARKTRHTWLRLCDRVVWLCCAERSLRPVICSDVGKIEQEMDAIQLAEVRDETNPGSIQAW